MHPAVFLGLFMFSSQKKTKPHPKRTFLLTPTCPSSVLVVLSRSDQSSPSFTHSFLPFQDLKLPRLCGWVRSDSVPVLLFAECYLWFSLWNAPEQCHHSCESAQAVGMLLGGTLTFESKNQNSKLMNRRAWRGDFKSGKYTQNKRDSVPKLCWQMARFLWHQVGQSEVMWQRDSKDFWAHCHVNVYKTFFLF